MQHYLVARVECPERDGIRQKGHLQDFCCTPAQAGTAARTARPTYTLTLQQLAQLAGGLNPPLQVGSGVEAGNRAQRGFLGCVRS